MIKSLKVGTIKDSIDFIEVSSASIIKVRFIYNRVDFSLLVAQFSEDCLPCSKERLVDKLLIRKELILFSNLKQLCILTLLDEIYTVIKAFDELYSSLLLLVNQWGHKGKPRMGTVNDSSS